MSIKKTPAVPATETRVCDYCGASATAVGKVPWWNQLEAAHRDYQGGVVGGETIDLCEACTIELWTELRNRQLIKAKPPSIPADAICFFKEGGESNQFVATYGNFVNLQESPAGFGDTREEAVIALLGKESGDAVRRGAAFLIEQLAKPNNGLDGLSK